MARDSFQKGNEQMSTITDLHRKMTEVLAGSADDAAKLDSGNAAAGRRLRKALKELKDLTAETRKTSIVVGKAGGNTASTPSCGEGKPASECCGGGANVSLGS